MRLLVVTEVLPWPLHSGNKVTQYAMLDYLQHEMDIHLAVFITTDGQREDARVLQKQLPKITIHICDLVQYNWDEANIDAPMSEEEAEDYSIPFLPIGMKRLAKAGSKLGLRFFSRFNPQGEDASNKKSYVGSIHENDFSRSYITDFYLPVAKPVFRFVSQLFALTKYDVVQVEFSNFLPLGTIIPEKCLKLFVSHELRFRRLESVKDSMSGFNQYERYMLGHIKMMEVLLMDYYDAVLVPSEKDFEVLEPTLKNAETYWSPFPLLQRLIAQTCVPPKEITKLIFLGSEGHVSNQDGLLWFVQEILPKVWKKVDIPLHIVGSWSSEKMADYSKYEHIHFDGVATDLVAALRNSIVVVPMLSASGVKSKVLYALGNNTPVVATQKGMEGLDLIPGRDLLMANEPDTFAQSIISIIKEPNVKETLVQHAYASMSRRYSQKALGMRRLQIYKHLYQQHLVRIG